MRARRSLFGPLLLIAAGVIAFLIQAGRVPLSNLWALAYLWPVLLIFGGLGLIFRRALPLVWDIVAILVVLGLVLAVMYAPRIGLPTTPVLGPAPFLAFGPVASGDVILEERTVGGFDAIALSYPANVTITQGPTERLSIEAPSDIMPELLTETRDGVLHISAPAGFRALLRPRSGLVQIEITVKDLSSLEFSSAGTVQVDGLRTDDLRVVASGAGLVRILQLSVRDLEVDLTGVGKVTASGRSVASDIEVSVSGLGSYDGSALQSRTAEVSISGAGSATVWATERLAAAVSGLGSVRYYGSPSVSSRSSGLGGVWPLGEK